MNWLWVGLLGFLVGCGGTSSGPGDAAADGQGIRDTAIDRAADRELDTRQTDTGQDAQSGDAAADRVIADAQASDALVSSDTPADTSPVSNFVFVCSNDTTCTNGQTCSAAFPGGTCLGCGNDNDCPGTMFCFGGSCLEGCNTFADCPNGLYCRSGGVCAARSCSVNIACQAPYTCDLGTGRCRRPTCAEGCPALLTCDSASGYCVEMQ